MGQGPVEAAGIARKPRGILSCQQARRSSLEQGTSLLQVPAVRPYTCRRSARMRLAGGTAAGGKRTGGKRGPSAPLRLKPGPMDVANEEGWGAEWKGEDGEEWMRWVAGLEEESKIEDHVISGRKGDCEQAKEEDFVCECDELLEEEGGGDEGRIEEWRATVSILLNGVAMKASLDTACWSVWVEESTFKAVGGKEFREGGGAIGADGTRLAVAGEGTLTMTLWGGTIPVTVPVMRSMPAKVLVGVSFMKKYGMVINLQQGKGFYSLGGVRYHGRVGHPLSESVEGVREVVSTTQEHGTVAVKTTWDFEREDILWEIRCLNLDSFGDDGDEESRMQLREASNETWEVFRPTLGDASENGEFHIKLTPEAEVSRLNRPAFLKSPKEREVEGEEMRRLLARGIIEPSDSPFGTNNVMVRKKALPDGSPGGIGVTADMRAVNSMTVGGAFPTEDIGMILSFLAKRKWFTVADLRDGYWNVRLAPESRYLTAVKTVSGLVQYTRMTMGLKNASAHFQRLVNNVYAGLKGVSLQVYLDDIADGSDTPEQQVKDVREMLQQTREAGLRLKLEKCGFGKDSIEILGHAISLGEVRPNDAHRKCVP
jgi:Reverse transcriptase (RNA-dependent DNA polymerase)